MDGHNLVAIYSSRVDAENVRNRLIDLGIPATDIRLSSAGAEGGAVGSAGERSLSHERHGSFWDWLFGSDVPEHDRSWYETKSARRSDCPLRNGSQRGCARARRIARAFADWGPRVRTPRGARNRVRLEVFNGKTANDLIRQLLIDRRLIWLPATMRTQREVDLIRGEQEPCRGDNAPKPRRNCMQVAFPLFLHPLLDLRR
jgi:hypothetical protein